MPAQQRVRCKHIAGGVVARVQDERGVWDVFRGQAGNVGAASIPQRALPANPTPWLPAAAPAPRAPGWWRPAAARLMRPCSAGAGCPAAAPGLPRAAGRPRRPPAQARAHMHAGRHGQGGALRCSAHLQLGSRPGEERRAGSGAAHLPQGLLLLLDGCVLVPCRRCGRARRAAATAACSAQHSTAQQVVSLASTAEGVAPHINSRCESGLAGGAL